MGLLTNLFLDWFFEVPEPYNNGAGEDSFQYFRKHPEELRKLDFLENSNRKRLTCERCGRSSTYDVSGRVFCRWCDAEYRNNHWDYDDDDDEYDDD